MSESFISLQKEVQCCIACPLSQTRKNVVFGMGVETAEVLFIGEAPGAQEDDQGLPFVGRSGQLLDKLLSCIDLYRDKNIYIANIIKCRPPENRDPLPEEQSACAKHLARQIEYINPKIIVCVGRIAAKRFIGEDFKVTTEHGKWFEQNGRLVMGTFHPAALLRNPNLKPVAFDDCLLLRDKINEICTHTY
ncbi:uracil-DNA glycosylase [Acetanaerobacterium elongatum]|uniref:Type-4 uracil-DNA glycosylase n=1 Tax=Acetanaerobacterium elongatum TaxID=258515 RepID=A0A1H0CW20_9FIRM|nr:uracil-DNA glycosylase [Acetanaerobacterium elongatum]SDN62045.1 DNA polymerase [Acetanaerobacterium elongatum]